MRLDGRTAIVTGSGRGIGRAIAVRLAREGADVAVNYGHHEDEARETLALVEAEGRRGLIVRADLGRVDDVRRPIREGAEHLGRLDVLVNNAGVESKSEFLDVDEGAYDAIVDVNLKGVFFACQAFGAMAVAAVTLLGAEATGVTDVRETVIRLFSPWGTLVVEVDDPGSTSRSKGRTSRSPGRGSERSA